MCGIIGVVVSANGSNNKNKTFRKIKGIFENQKSRGVDGAGFLSTNVKGWRGTVGLRYRTEDAVKLFKNRNKISKILKENNKILFHHRFPTSNKNDEGNNHPILDEKKRIGLVHNGVVWNDESLITKLEGRGHVFETGVKGEKANDSEVLVHLIEEKLKGTKHNNKDIVEAVQYLNDEANGQIAIAFVVKGQDAVYLWKRNNPLNIYVDKLKNIYFSSVLPKSQGYKTLITMNDDEVVKITNKTVKVIGKTTWTNRYPPACAKHKSSNWSNKDKCFIYSEGDGLDDWNEDFSERFDKTKDYAKPDDTIIGLDKNVFWQYIKQKQLPTSVGEKAWDLAGKALEVNAQYDDAVELTVSMEEYIETILEDSKNVYEKLKRANKHLIKAISRLEEKVKVNKVGTDSSMIWLKWTKERITTILECQSVVTKKETNRELKWLMERLEQMIPTIEGNSIQQDILDKYYEQDRFNDEDEYSREMAERELEDYKCEGREDRGLALLFG